jgi:hypothetical protein
MKKFTIWGKRIFIVTGVVLLLLLVTDFNSRMAELTRLRAQKEEEIEYVDELFATQYALETQIGYAESDEAVEAWAREQEHSVLPGDFPVVPIADPAYQTIQESENKNIEINHNHWENWLLWLFGSTEESIP